jgi:3-deoxy-manno-octulosonate cytidylyltransferase (CMP-KDO synthetase)
MSEPIVVIPARMGASRLPGKPLADIAGRPMIAWMVDIALKANVGPVLVAAGEPEIAAAAEAAGARAVLTDPALPSGTDRVLAAVGALDKRHDVIVNLQGDMPTMPARLIAAALDALSDDADIATLVSPSSDAADRENPNLVKAIVGENGRALYFTRTGAPWGEGPIQRHVGIYVFRRSALERFVKTSPTALERREKLEQLRALEMGLVIKAGSTPFFPKGVDGPEDLEVARRELVKVSCAAVD